MAFITHEKTRITEELPTNTGISAPAVRLGRILDRMADGEYLIRVRKTSAPHAWEVNVLSAGKLLELGR